MKKEEIINDPKYIKLKNFIAHSNITCYKHCIEVAENSYRFAKKYKIKVNYDDLMLGALLHDYYLYDWHNSDISWHGFKHHKIACNNAIRDFDINKKVQKIIYCHMFPLTIWTVPTSKEAIIVSLMDKKVATKETLYKYYKSKNLD